MDWGALVLVMLVGLIGFSSMVFTICSWHEREKRAAAIGAVLLAICLLVEAALIVLWRQGWLTTNSLAVYIADGVLAGVMIALIIPFGRNSDHKLGTAYYKVGEVQRYDERDNIFSRIRSLRPGTWSYEEYYQRHPQRKAPDDLRRDLGGAMGEVVGKIDLHNHLNLAALRGLIPLPMLFGNPEVVKPRPINQPGQVAPQELTLYIKGLAKYLGADLVGVARLDPRWIYSNKGGIFFNNDQDWGKPIESDHPFAVVMATEMDREMLMTGAHTPASIETYRNYNLGTAVSIQLAACLAEMGYRATANHLRHYEVMCVPLAIDAGLGELGRHGYLVTKEFGPRVRLSVVTTDAPLIPDNPVDIGVQHFCEHCQKCAHLCPSKSIPTGEKTVANGLRRWYLDAGSCSTWWAKVGSACSICMAVCPWSHPNTLIHRASKYLIVRSALARRVLAWADDFFYGNYKGDWYGPEWCDYRRGKGSQTEMVPPPVSSPGDRGLIP